ncbi:MAG: hypothetical protein H7Y43_08160, partial [Akkermansiaceae bacterium]|nr:hypothetical protein [Verrucomicrobiales bacterium]
MKMLIALCLSGLFLSQARCHAAESNLVIHEWGTFTSLQNETGEAIGGINTDDEPVPGFVHRLAPFLLLSPNEVRNRFSQGVPFCHPDVSMRLETPVIYFHPHKAEPKLERLSVNVKFHGGWLSEFYPHAIAEAPGLEGNRNRGQSHRFGPLKTNAVGTLDWHQLQVGGNWPLTNTSEHVWLAPRNVQAALVRTTNGESEKFLFYRGVANLNAPLRISLDSKSDHLVFRGQLEMPAAKPLVIPKLWFVHIRSDGDLAFRTLPALTLKSGSTRILAHTPGSFGRKEFASRNLARLRKDLLEALMQDGLFRDEAEALLNTWQLSYFKSPGMRVFFIVPPEWTDYYLPLSISAPAQVDRVMVGRIELITPEQRVLLAKIGSYSETEIAAAVGTLGTNLMNFILREPKTYAERYGKLTAGRAPMNDFISVPDVFQTYLDLGRFRAALILHEAKRHPAPGITNFIARFGVLAYRTFEPGQAPPG